MKTHCTVLPALLPSLLLALFACPTALAGDVQVEITGTITEVDGIYSPGFPAAAGDPIRLRFEVHVPGNVAAPQTSTIYAIDPASFSITTTADSGLQIRRGTFFLQDDNAGMWLFDGFGVIGVQGFGNWWLSLSAGMDTSFLDGHQVHENLGTRAITNNFAWLGCTIQVGSTVISSQLESLSITALPGGTEFCAHALPNSTGQPTQLLANRLEVPGAGWHLEALQGPRGQAGYLVVGSLTQSPGLALGQGRLCLDTGPGALIGRYNQAGTVMDSIGFFDPSGRWLPAANLSVLGAGFDLPSTLPIPGNPAIATGSTWYFQLWHRDVGATSNLSNGISLTF